MTEADERKAKKTPRQLLVLMQLCSVACAAVLFSGQYLPLTDLPQHEGQLALWRRFGESAHLPELYELNLFTPYLLFYAIGRLFCLVLSVHEAIRCLVLLAVLGLPWAHLVLLRRVGGDPYWALIGFPLAFNVSYTMGFLNFILALPIGLLLVAGAHGLAERQTWPRAIGVALLGVTLFFGHALAWLGCTAMAAAAAITRGRDPRARLLALAPLGAAAPIALGWFVMTREQSPLARAATVWSLGLERLSALPGHAFGDGPMALTWGALLGVAVLLGVRRIARAPERWSPWAVASALYLLLPWHGMGVAHLFSRYGVLVVLSATLAFEPLVTSARRRNASRALLACTALLFSVHHASAIRAFNHDAAGAEAVLAELPTTTRGIYGLILDPKHASVGGDPFLHFAQFAHLEHDVIEPSFARSYQSLVRYPAGTRPPLHAADPLAELRNGPYDHVLVRSELPILALYPRTFSEWRPLATRDGWSVWARR
jgi:hypothetical protein